MSELLTYDAEDEAATGALGAALATVLPASAVIALIGPLGAGKTRLVQAVARGAGVGEGIVSSPTFVLVHEYMGRAPIFHFDAFRLKGDAEFQALGPDEYFSQAGWTFIEWADRVAGSLPRERLEISIETTGPTARKFTIRAIGPRYDDALAALRHKMA